MQKKVFDQFRKNKLALFAFAIIVLFCLVGIYAPFLASSKPIVVVFDGKIFFPLFRYLFFTGFYSKQIDIFFNVMIFTFPVALLGYFRRYFLIFAFLLQCAIFSFLFFFPIKDPAADINLIKARELSFQKLLDQKQRPTFAFDLNYMNDYAKLNLVLKQKNLIDQDKALRATDTSFDTAYRRQQALLEEQRQNYIDNKSDQAFNYLTAKQAWLADHLKKISLCIMPIIRPYHWEDDAGGQQSMNARLPWWELTRINRKDLTSALIFGVRISLVVGLASVGLALLIGVPIGALSGYWGGGFDIVICRLLEVWESMPTFFMLLLIVAMTESKSIFLVISVVGLFGWTGFARFIRAEFFKQRKLSYVSACRAIGFPDFYIIFSHILPNAIAPVLTLLPFSIMAAIGTEAGLSFLGLGEESSTSWGVLMDEGRSAFPGESYLLWPPAILLTVLLVAIALVGDGLRDAQDPKMQKD